VVDAGLQTSVTLEDLDEGQVYYFAVAAYDTTGDESELTSEVASDGPIETDEDDLPEGYELDHPDIDYEAGSDGYEESSWQDEGEMAFEDHVDMEASDLDAESPQGDEHSDETPTPDVIPYSELRVVSVDSETLVGDGAADAAIDGRPETFWHTETGSRASHHPHELVIALGDEYMVRAFRYLPRQDGKSDGMVARYRFFVSEDGQNWGNAIAVGKFSKDKVEKEVAFAGKVGSFVKFVSYAEVDGNPLTSMAELSIVGMRP
jgi:hypothetical protein